jgi:catechol 2,3-dioxygenase-like lactoylglutathione lyase family enzyme
MILHHLALSVVCLEESQKFYDAVLMPLGCELVEQNEAILVYDKDNECEFLLYKSDPRLSGSAHQLYQPGFHHMALHASSAEQVDAIYEPIVGLFGKNHIINAPENYPEYLGSRYYAAFLLDPSNLKIEIMHQQKP